ncbi:MAG: pseudouridine synthase [Candidatus Saccharimonadales bacterium]
MSERLNKYLAFQLGISRREADGFIEHGHVAVDGKKAILGARFEEGTNVTVKGKSIQAGESKQYLMLNKPIGYVSSRKSQGDVPTIYELLPAKYHALKPVGRLDKNSSGLILLTNDGDFAYQMTHPKFYKVKKYTVTLDDALAPLHQQMINDHGINLEDGVSKLTLERTDDTRLHWIVTMTEGRNRQIRRTFHAIGYEVTSLHRTNFGNFALNGLEPGSFIPVTI